MAAQQEMTNQVKRLQTVLDLAQSLELPSAKITEHKMNLYNFANLPCPKGALKISDMANKSSKRDVRSTPASAALARTENSSGTTADVGVELCYDQTSLDNLGSPQMIYTVQ